MSTNFLQHNPTEANQDTDAQYLADNTRTAGLGVDQIVPSIWMNKILYQVSTFVAAFAQTLSNKGYNCSDADINALEAVLANVITNADTKPGFITVPYSSAPVFNAALASGFRFNLNAAVPSSTLINATFGQILTFAIQNNMGVDPGTFTWPTNVLDGYSISLSTPSHVNTQQFIILEDGNAYSLTTMIDRLILLYNDTQAQITNLQNQINTANGNISSLFTTTTNLQFEINTINGNVAGLQSQINGIQTNKQNNLGFAPVHQGGGIGQLFNTVFVGWSGSRLKGQVDATDLGNFVFDGNMISYVSSVISGLFAGSLGANGWIALGSLIVQWGSNPNLGGGSGGQQVTISYPRSFPNAIFTVVAGTFGFTDAITYVASYNTNSFVVGNNRSGCGVSWVAFGI